MFTHSIHGAEVPEKYGPHGERFLVLVQKELATMLGGESKSPFLNADIRTFSLPMSSGSVRLSPCIQSRKQESEKMDVFFLAWGTSGK